MSRPKIALIAGLLAVALPVAAQSATPTVDKADTVWLALSTVLVLLMTPALALFYGGMVRRDNVLSSMLHSFVAMGVVAILWLVAGYSIAFAPSNGWFGNFDFAFGRGMSMSEVQDGLTIPQGLFMLFQMMFAIITPALISGAIAERMRFAAYVLFISVWSLLVYAPVACWVWNPNGWLFKHGALDFAGGTVVHLASGAAALAAALVLGKRTSLHKEPILPNNITATLLGAGLLWVGWIGFNAGSAYAMNDVALNAFAATQLAAAGGLVGWLLMERVFSGKPTALGAASGIVAGLVGVTPAAGFVSPAAGCVIGLICGVACWFAVSRKHRFSIDDALDVVGIHGVGGLIGAILTGVFATVAVNSAVVGPALESGRMALILKQVVAVGAVAAYSFAASWILLKIVGRVTPLRASLDEEDAGLDIALHGESGYNL